jgi:ABC-2 type transport system ATP-binding protein
MIAVRDRRKAYGPVEAVRGLDLEVRAGEVVAFLGPNGAGKTTTVEILEGFRPRDGGTVEVLGEDPARPSAGWRARIGVVLQESEPPPLLTVTEALDLFAGYFPAPRTVPETIELVGLGAQAEQRAQRLSGGQRRRLDVALALIGDPELLFLDEPTTGFDPSARRQAWDVIAGLRDLGKTVFLTTHYMDEAQHLADRVAVIVHGEIVALGSPDALGDREHAPATIRFLLPAGRSLDELPLDSSLASVDGDGAVSVSTTEPVPLLNRLTGWALDNSVDLASLEVRRPSLEDVYLELTANQGPDAEVPRVEGARTEGEGR